MGVLVHLLVLCLFCVLCITAVTSSELPIYGGTILEDDSLTTTITSTTNNVQCVEVVYNTACQLTLPFVSLVLCVLSAIIVLL